MKNLVLFNEFSTHCKFAYKNCDKKGDFFLLKTIEKISKPKRQEKSSFFTSTFRGKT